jgi:hypothetical protein
MKIAIRAMLILGLLLALPSPFYSLELIIAKVVDATTGKPIAGAIVTTNAHNGRTNAKGEFAVLPDDRTVAVRACGYRRSDWIAVSPIAASPIEIRLSPITPKGLYLTVFGIGSRVLRNSALQLIEETDLNSLVIDVKGDRGIVPYKSSVALASSVGSQKVITVRDMKAVMKTLKEKGLYTIARIVVFKDNPLATSRPEFAVKTPEGTVWQDREGLAWVDPFSKEVWDYNIDLAVEAAQYGFDEIQFDYVRFPDTAGLQFSQPNTEDNRVKAISGFLAEARKRLAPYNVFLDADIFGYVCWNLNDTQIGQRLEDLAGALDYLCPMLYPSGFQYGIPGYRNPLDHPYEMVYLSLKNAAKRAHLSANRFRPWLQSFRDYAVDGRVFGAKQIRDQISAAEDFGSNGWMLWNPHNVYSKDCLQPKGPRP